MYESILAYTFQDVLRIVVDAVAVCLALIAVWLLRIWLLKRMAIKAGRWLWSWLPSLPSWQTIQALLPWSSSPPKAGSWLSLVRPLRRRN